MIPSEDARRVMLERGHCIVVIIGYDDKNGQLDVASYGSKAVNKDVAAHWADKVAGFLMPGLDRTIVREDFRATPEALYKEQVDALRSQLEKYAAKFGPI